jgi:hypothetical protein
MSSEVGGIEEEIRSQRSEISKKKSEEKKAENGKGTGRAQKVES